MNATPDKAKARRTLLLLALVALAPIVASGAAYYWLTPAKRVNYGELLDPRLALSANGLRLDGRPFALSDLRGEWVLVMVSGSGCGDDCRRTLYATRQARTMQGRDRDRVARVWVQPASAPPPLPELLAEHPGLIGARVDPAEFARLPIDDGVGILLLDPHGNPVLRYVADPDIRRLANDLERLLRVSRIG